MVKKLREYNGIQGWYADESAFAGNFIEMEKWENRLEELGPCNGYYPEPAKSILIVHPRHEEEAKRRFEHKKFTIVNGHCYLGGYIGDRAKEKEYFERRIAEWVERIERVAGMAYKYPQSVYTAISK